MHSQIVVNPRFPQGDQNWQGGTSFGSRWPKSVRGDQFWRGTDFFVTVTHVQTVMHQVFFSVSLILLPTSEMCKLPLSVASISNVHLFHFAVSDVLTLDSILLYS